VRAPRVLVVLSFPLFGLTSAFGQVKADLSVTPAAGVGAAGASAVVPLSGASLAAPVSAAPNLLAPSAPMSVLMQPPALAVQAAPAALAAPALPAALTLPAAAAAATANAPSRAAKASDGAGGDADMGAASFDEEHGWKAGAQMFDFFLGEAEGSPSAAPAARSGGAAPLSAWSARAARSPEAAAFARAVGKASDAGWRGQGAPAVDAAEIFLSARGVKVERIPNGLRVVARRGISPLNDLADDVNRRLGATVAYMPERTRDASAAYNGRERLLMAAGFERPDFFLAVLHETRHAWYSELLRRGDIRLFHLQAVARPGRSVAPNAEVYASYLSLEELSTFPKTLKQMISEQAKLEGEAARYLADRTAVRGRQYVDILRSAAHLGDQIEALDKAKRLNPRRLTPEEADAAGLEPAEGLDYFALELPQATLYVPVRQRLTRRFGRKDVMRGSPDEARASLRERARLIRELVTAAAPSAGAYLEAARAGDWAAAGAAADRLIAATRRAENAWPAAKP
jgi:hypothetical protein